MKRFARRALAAGAGIALAFTFLMGAPGAGVAATATWLDVVAPAQVRLAGSSNLAPWSCRSEQVAGTLEVAAVRERVLAAAERIAAGDPIADDLPLPTFTLTVPVATLRCGKRAMERDLQSALRADLHPVIAFHLDDVHGSPRRRDGSTVVTVGGTVSLNGVEREVEVEVLAERLDAQRFRARAELPLRMTWFDVAPPRALFGLVQADDALRVGLDLTLAFTD